MNRIILIGNGFDCAHGLYTKYSDFIDWFWERQLGLVNQTNSSEETWKKVDISIDINNVENYRKYQQNDFFDVKFQEKEGKKLSDFDKKSQKNEEPQNVQNADNKSSSNIKTDVEQKPKFKNVEELKKNIEYKNKFLELIDKKKKIQNWVDIEELYFEVLTNCKNRRKESESVYEIYTVEELNRDFKNIKHELARFIQIRNSEISGNKEFIDELQKSVVDDVKKIILRDAKCKETINEILLLNFNYSNTVFELYHQIGTKKFIKDDDTANLKIISIHGSVKYDDNNPMIFGYGDELSEDSTDIEKLNDNHFLENVKSIKYVETDNFLKLLDFVQKDIYDVFVFGHSCGNSDRTLLKDLFENPNCKEIRCFYYHDNFNITIDNIYRKFKDKTEFRKKILQKSKDDDFPQIKDESKIPVTIKPKTKKTEQEDIGKKENESEPKERGTTEQQISDYKSTYMIEVKFDINKYYIGKYQVTQKEWEQVMGNNPSHFKGNDLPVECVNWYNVIDFCNKLSEKYYLRKYYNRNGNDVTVNVGANGFRLPTEAQWEFAATSKGKYKIKEVRYTIVNDEKKEIHLFARNEKTNNIDDLSWYRENSEYSTHPVGQKQPNDLGLYDMSGNVWEWCEDWYDKKGSYRVYRGGSWGSAAEYCRVAYRGSRSPGDRDYFLGFRVVLP